MTGPTACIAALPIQYAHDIIHTYKTSNPFCIAEYLNIIVIEVPLIDINGFYQNYDNNHLIYLSDKLYPSKKKFVLAHEIGHMLLHSNKNVLK